MRGKLFTVALSLGLALASSALAQSPDPNWQRCWSGKPDEAISGCTAVIQSGKETGENLAHALRWRGTGYVETGRYDLAIADLSRAIRLDPLDEAYYSERGFAYYDKGQYDRAIADLGQALNLDSSGSGSGVTIDGDTAWRLYIRGLARMKTGDAAGGNADLAKATRIIPDIADQYAKYWPGPR